jgi:hypothetical protein
MKRLIVFSTVVLTLIVNPCFAIEYCKDFLESGNPGGWSASLKPFDDEWTMGAESGVELEIWINDVTEPLLTAGYVIQFDPGLVKISNVIPYDTDNGGPWDPSFTTSFEAEPGQWACTVGDWCSYP